LCDANILIADVEPEDLDLGNFDQDGLAFDVDENMDQEDIEALDSDDEQNLDEELGLGEDSDGTRFSFRSLGIFLISHLCSADAYCPLVLPPTKRETDACLRATPAWLSSCCGLY
jgi:hypothetical protein